MEAVDRARAAAAVAGILTGDPEAIPAVLAEVAADARPDALAALVAVLACDVATAVVNACDDDDEALRVARSAAVEYRLTADAEGGVS
ncbi:hypothetical protein [Microbacterium enclense]|uniref:hypothetical protein n=1 Tax=Microbacterium enclense TaxID=993073 RepID=UPI003F812EBC